MFYILLFCSFLVAPVSSENCGLPPSLWCSSREVARKCDVETQCEPFLSSAKKEGPLVNFTLYTETLCPYCILFISNQLYPTFKSIGSIMNLEIVPYGNAKEQQVGDKWQFTCQHGIEECYGNLIETCAIHYHQNISVYLPFIHCIELDVSKKLTPRQSAPACAEKLGLDYSQIKSCADGPLGNSLEHKMGLKTRALQPPQTYVPWLTLNGVHNKQIQYAAQHELEELICRTYQGSPKPAACSYKLGLKNRLINILN